MPTTSTENHPLRGYSCSTGDRGQFRCLTERTGDRLTIRWSGDCDTAARDILDNDPDLIEFNRGQLLEVHLSQVTFMDSAGSTISSPSAYAPDKPAPSSWSATPPRQSDASWNSPASQPSSSPTEPP